MNDIQQPKIADQHNILLQISNFAGGWSQLLCENLKNLTHFTRAFYRRFVPRAGDVPMHYSNAAAAPLE